MLEPIWVISVDIFRFWKANIWTYRRSWYCQWQTPVGKIEIWNRSSDHCCEIGFLIPPKRESFGLWISEGRVKGAQLRDNAGKVSSGFEGCERKGWWRVKPSTGKEKILNDFDTSWCKRMQKCFLRRLRHARNRSSFACPFEIELRMQLVKELSIHEVVSFRR